MGPILCDATGTALRPKGAPAVLRPDHRAAGVGECRRLLLPVLRSWQHLDAVDQDRVGLLVEEAQITLDLRAFRDGLRSLRPDLVARRI